MDRRAERLTSAASSPSVSSYTAPLESQRSVFVTAPCWEPAAMMHALLARRGQTSHKKNTRKRFVWVVESPLQAERGATHRVGVGKLRPRGPFGATLAFYFGRSMLGKKSSFFRWGWSTEHYVCPPLTSDLSSVCHWIFNNPRILNETENNVHVCKWEIMGWSQSVICSTASV